MDGMDLRDLMDTMEKGKRYLSIPSILSIIPTTTNKAAPVHPGRPCGFAAEAAFPPLLRHLNLL